MHSTGFNNIVGIFFINSIQLYKNEIGQRRSSDGWHSKGIWLDKPEIIQPKNEMPLNIQNEMTTKLCYPVIVDTE